MNVKLYKGDRRLRSLVNHLTPLPTRAYPTTINLTITMPPRKKAAYGGTDSSITQDPLTTGAVRSSARIASQAVAAAVNPDPTTDGPTSPKPLSQPKHKAPPKRKPTSGATQSTSKLRSKRTKPDTDDNEDDTPASKKQRITTVDEEEEEAMDADTQDHKKDDKKDDRKIVSPHRASGRAS